MKYAFYSTKRGEWIKYPPKTKENMLLAETLLTRCLVCEGKLTQQLVDDIRLFLNKGGFSGEASG